MTIQHGGKVETVGKRTLRVQHLGHNRGKRHMKRLSQELKYHLYRQGHINVRNDVLIQKIIASIFEEEDRLYDYPRA
jgi:hypothetical protein